MSWQVVVIIALIVQLMCVYRVTDLKLRTMVLARAEPEKISELLDAERARRGL